MHHERLDHWQHDHVFGQDLKRSGETRTLIVVGLTLAMDGLGDPGRDRLWLNGFAG